MDRLSCFGAWICRFGISWASLLGWVCLFFWWLCWGFRGEDVVCFNVGCVCSVGYILGWSVGLWAGQLIWLFLLLSGMMTPLALLVKLLEFLLHFFVYLFLYTFLNAFLKCQVFVDCVQTVSDILEASAVWWWLEWPLLLIEQFWLPFPQVMVLFSVTQIECLH